MKPQTHDEWFKTVDRPRKQLGYLLTADAWNTSHAATKESAVLIVKSYLSDDRTSSTRNAICESIAEEIDKL